MMKFPARHHVPAAGSPHLHPGTFEAHDMLTPSKADCITILSAADSLAASDPDTVLPLDYRRLGLSRNGMETAAVFLIERACFTRYVEDHGQFAVGRLSQQGKWRLEQLCNG
jgi:hypothetical protein